MCSILGKRNQEKTDERGGKEAIERRRRELEKVAAGGKRWMKEMIKGHSRLHTYTASPFTFLSLYIIPSSISIYHLPFVPLFHPRFHLSFIIILFSLFNHQSISISPFHLHSLTPPKFLHLSTTLFSSR